VLRNEKEGGPALFNCATGLFDLDWLISKIEEIAQDLPIRVSDQDKDAGRYAQAEITTWEVLPLVEDPLILAVPKERRFIAAKMLMETLLSSPDRKDEPGSAEAAPSQAAPSQAAPLKAAAERLKAGFRDLLSSRYGLVEGVEGRRRALSVKELEERIQSEMRWR